MFYCFKRKRQVDTLSCTIAELKQTEEKKIKLLEEIATAVVDSNKEQTDALRAMNETLRKLIEKL